MDAPKRTQKQVAERLKGNLDYYNRLHPFRGLRFMVSAVTILAGLAAVPAYYYLHGPEQFFNPGPISRAHNGFAQDCAACHTNTRQIKADTHKAGEIVRQEYFVSIDKTCGDCHTYSSFHAPNIVPDTTRRAGTGAQYESSSCSACHREHRTAGSMMPPENSNCAACHARQDLMSASSKAGLSLAPDAFPDSARKGGGLLWFPKPRPREGFTRAFESFDKGHPAFQIHQRGLKDPDTLQYNHARHEMPDIPKTEKGKKLECNYCHKTDATGTNFQRISFDANCRYCHELKFDPNTPELAIPHGDPEKVRAFLRTLPNQYVEYAIRKKGMNSQQAQGYAAGAVQALANLYGGAANPAVAGPRLEQQVFYNGEHVGTGAGALQRRSSSPAGPEAIFPGCAYCHQVSAPQPNVTPRITRAVIFDRWLGDGNFNHAKHTQQSCSECHDSVHKSKLTSDINVPTQKSCTQCHNSGPKGVANDCMSCHHYHNDPRMRTIDPKDKTKTIDPKKAKPGGKTADSDEPGSFRDMLLGSADVAGH